MADEHRVKKCFPIALDISRPISNRAFTLVEGDTGNELIISLTDDGEPVDLTSCRVMALFSKSDGTTVSQDSGTEGNGVAIGGTANNEITIELCVSSFTPGMVECEIQVYSGAALSVLVTSAKFNFKCRRSILNPDTILAVPEYPLLTSLLRDVTTLSQQTGELTSAVQAALSAVQTNETARSGAEALRADAEAERILAEDARVSAEAARGSAELARASAELARSSGYASLEGRLDAAVSDADGLVEELEAAVESLPEIASVSGILKGDGTGGVSAATANSDYYEPPLRSSNLSVTTGAWVSDTTYADYPYRASVSVTGALATMIPEVVFALADAVSGILAPVAEAYAGGVYIYASEIPAAAATIATLTLWKGVS